MSETKEPPFPCLGHWYDTPNGREYDCDYAHNGDIDCEQCVCVGGRYDPRTGKLFKAAKKKEAKRD